MKVNLTHILATVGVVILLIAGNVYQYQNPQTVEIPEGQTAIDSTAWVQQAAYATRGMIIDSLRSQNENMAQRIEQYNDKISNYTSIVGKLNLKVDSLENREPVRIDSFFTFTDPEEKQVDLGVKDTTVIFNHSIGDGLFHIKSAVEFNWPYLDNRIYPSQQRPIRIDVANTMNDSRTRLLTYVTSPDFDSLQYETYTELEPKNELPKFWIGAGSGVIATLAGILILR